MDEELKTSNPTTTGFLDGVYEEERRHAEMTSMSNSTMRKYRSSQFTSYLAKFGNWNDTSMTAATREKSRTEVVDLRRQASLNRVNSYFNIEAKRVEKLQRAIAKKQQQLAYTAMEKYAAVKLQMAYRSRKARKELQAKKLMRMITCWMVFRLRLKKRMKAGRFISRNLRILMGRSKLARIVTEAVAARKITAHTKRKVAQRKAKLVIYNKEASLATSKIAIGVAMEKARKLIEMNQRLKREKYAREILQYKFLPIYVRNLRYKKLMRPKGKWLFYHLINDIVKKYDDMKSNYIMNHIKQRILMKEQKEADDLAVARKSARKSGKPQPPPGKKQSIVTPKSSSKGGKGGKKKKEEEKAPSPLPKYMKGLFACKCSKGDFSEVVFLFIDLLRVALEKPEYFNGETPEELFDLKGDPPVFRKKFTGKRKQSISPGKKISPIKDRNNKKPTPVSSASSSGNRKKIPSGSSSVKNKSKPASPALTPEIDELTDDDIFNIDWDEPTSSSITVPKIQPPQPLVPKSSKYVDAKGGRPGRKLVSI